MWWEKIVFGQELYKVTLWFLAYSILGWVLESIYMSICNRKLTNRGFAKGPFCPIYGVGALTVYFVLRFYSEHTLILFVLGALFATFIEFVTAWIMMKVFGEVWWDYHDKPFNYKGVLCLESTIAWGFYTLFLFMFLQNMIDGLVNKIPVHIGRVVGSALILIFMVDFLIQLYREKKDSIPNKWVERGKRIKDRLLGNE